MAKPTPVRAGQAATDVTLSNTIAEPPRGSAPKQPMDGAQAKPARAAKRPPRPGSDGGEADRAAPVQPGGDIGLEEREEMIRMAAYERYLQRQGQGGSAIDDWLQAEAAIDSPGRQTDQQRQKPP